MGTLSGATVPAVAAEAAKTARPAKTAGRLKCVAPLNIVSAFLLSAERPAVVPFAFLRQVRFPSLPVLLILKDMIFCICYAIGLLPYAA
ncbi:hypothetical protein LAB1_14620 [Roseibium sp. LAB1]